MKPSHFFYSKIVLGLPAGSSFFRARRCDTANALDGMLKKPEKELAPPSKEIARAGRMNPAGVSFFYGAEHRDTCVAELRPPVGGLVVSGEFRLIQPLKVFDFTGLATAYMERPTSYFDVNYDERVERERFIETLHEKISRPVLPDSEHEYLATQVIAEYLASQFVFAFDGVMFRSSQHGDSEPSRNITLFSHALNAIELVPDSLQVHEVKRARYQVETRNVRKGEIETFAEDYESEWDWD